MTLAVSYMRNQTLRLAQFFTNQFYDINIAHLVMTADIIYLAYSALMDNQINRLAMILDIQPIAYIQAFAIYRQQLIRQSICKHQRNQLFREVIRAIVIAAARNSNRQTIGSIISHNKQVCASFRGRIRTAGMNRSFFREEQVRSV